GGYMSLPSPKICRRIRSLFGQISDPHKSIHTKARKALLKLLAEHGLSWVEIPACVAAADEDDRVRAAQASHRAPQYGPPSSASAPPYDVLHLALDLVEMHVAITPEERMAVALWILHTYVFDRFDVTPRLGLLSPVRGYGKTTLLILLDLLVADPYRTDNVTPAAIYYLLERRAHTLLIDEGDNLGLLNNSVLRSVVNSGHRRGGGVSRYVAGRARKFPTFAPLAVAAIGSMPLPLLHRAVIINMQRASSQTLTRLDEKSAVFPAARAEIYK